MSEDTPPTMKRKEEELDKVIKRIVFPAGIDDEYHPILVVAASRFPSPDQLPPGVDFNTLVERSLNLISPIASVGSYSFIIFASPSEYGPTVKQIISAYLLFERPIRKNLKKLYVVHPSFWAKMTIQVFLNGIVSWKMGRKVHWVNSLSALAKELPIYQICIPPEVYKFNLTIESQIEIPSSAQQDPIFGIPLTQLMGQNAEGGIPRVVRNCIECLKSCGLKSEGLFRRPPSSMTLKTIRDAYDRGHPVDLSDYPDAPYLAASLLKLFLRELPEPMFEEGHYPIIRACPVIQPHSILGPDYEANPPAHLAANTQPIQYIKEDIRRCMRTHSDAVLLSYVLKLCHELALLSDYNKMDSHNLATCLAPTLLRSKDLMTDALMCKLPPANSNDSVQIMTVQNQPLQYTSLGSVLKLMIDCYPAIFDEQELSVCQNREPSSELCLHMDPDLTTDTSSSNSSPQRQPMKSALRRANTTSVFTSPPPGPSEEMINGIFVGSPGRERLPNLDGLRSRFQSDLRRPISMISPMFCREQSEPEEVPMLSHVRSIVQSNTVGHQHKRTNNNNNHGLGFNSMIIPITEICSTNVNGRISIRELFEHQDQISNDLNEID